MDKTLAAYLEESEDIVKLLLFKVATKKELETYRNKLVSNIKTIQAVAKRLSDISNDVTRLISNREPSQEKKEVDILDPYPYSTDYGVLRVGHQPKITAMGHHIPAISVTNSTEIPAHPLYYITSTKQFAINIFGIIIKGTFAKLAGYKELQTEFCQFGQYCKDIKSCKYYHHPKDFVDLQADLPTDYLKGVTQGHFIYDPKHKKKHTRQIGDYTTLEKDIKESKNLRSEIYNREYMIINDILLYLLLQQKNLIPDYKNWKGC